MEAEHSPKANKVMLIRSNMREYSHPIPTEGSLRSRLKGQAWLACLYLHTLHTQLSFRSDRQREWQRDPIDLI